MKSILIDSSIWSQVLRRKKNIDFETRKTLINLIEEGRSQIIGPIRQEILSGIKEETQFDKIKDTLAAFENHNIDPIVYEIAAKFNNICRSNGIQGSHTDYLICAVGHYYNMKIYTSDNALALESPNIQKAARSNFTLL